MVEIWSNKRLKEMNNKLVKSKMMVTSKCKQHRIKIRQQNRNLQVGQLPMNLTPRLPHQEPKSWKMAAISMVNMSNRREFLKMMLLRLSRLTQKRWPSSLMKANSLRKTRHLKAQLTQSLTKKRKTKIT